MAFLVLTICFIVCACQYNGCAGHAADDNISPAVNSGFSSRRHRYLVTAPPKRASTFSTIGHSLQKEGHSAPAMHVSGRPTLASPAPSGKSIQHTARPRTHSVAFTPENSNYKHHHHRHYHHHDHHPLDSAKKQFGKSAAGASYPPPLPRAQQARPPAYAVSPFRSPDSSTTSQSSRMPAPSPSVLTIHIHPPSKSPWNSVEMTPPPALVWALPPPPPNQDCAAFTCAEPLTYTPSGFPCGCVYPVQVRLLLNISLYTFFPLVSELAAEIASSLSLNQSQVRIMGANAASQQLEKTIVLVNLVLMEEKFKYNAAFSAYEKFWHKKIHVKYSLFGAYDVLDVHYPGLPPSPPSLSSNLAAIDDHPFPANHKGNGGSLLKPLGVDVPKRQKNGLGSGVAAVITISCITAVVTCAAIAWILIASRTARQHKEALPTPVSSFTKPSGAARSLPLGSRSLSGSLSFSSGVLNFTGSAKVFSLDDMERATDGFDASRVLGEGGFGVVYRGTLHDEEQVAVKVLKKDNHHGIREFLSEVEMLSRLHHRHLVKLFGICTEDHVRCLVYELVPNGSVESHLYGVDKEVCPLDWATRVKIALGAARGLAYLHEDASPCVIHRDFKSSNILLERDFTPKVSDFGLATNALNGKNQAISTHVIGTFGYLAPEYAMTGHLLVKSDVYSYGVVLLELLTGRKPVDFSMPPGQENLVAWANPLLTSKDGLETIMDPTLRSSAPFESFSKVAAIASMCVQLEVSCRPFMGEVVQALRLVCCELDEANEEGPRSSFNQEKVSLDEDSKNSKIVGELEEFLGTHCPVLGYESSSDGKIALSAVDLVSASAEYKQDYESLRRHYSSGPLGLGSKRPFWQRLGRFSRSSMREHLWPRSH